MATQIVLNPKYQTNWAVFNKTTNKTTETVEAKNEEVTAPDESIDPVCPKCGENPCICDNIDVVDDTTTQEPIVGIEDGIYIKDDDSNVDDTEINDEDKGDNDAIITFHEAQEYMKKTFGLTHKDVISREKLLEQMEAHGVEFPDLTL